ncbi:hypothetical protein [Stagnihabitans tardus]|uniref:Uncharacterized protein n=1 Tax=Stagnihabitans tardus TaxID=2699202 RepID=A0AAE4Y8F3_9RHOB|nr:hypothetical protein [Stagnihabitans tardus]NBZ87129.1 hypothetical protein [Stagnihabitans tardus]
MFKSSSLNWIGLSVTCAYVLTVTVIVFIKVEEFTSLKLNELGDFLAGVLGPIGILWLILGFFQQSRELQNSVDALNLQARELNDSVYQQKELVSLTREQLQEERERVHREEQARKIRIQPVIVARFEVLSTIGGNEFRYCLRVSNIGNSASNFQVRAFDGPEVICEHFERYIERGWASKALNAIDIIHGPRFRKPVSLIMSYQDEDGNQWTLRELHLPVEAKDGFDTFERASFERELSLEGRL